MRFDSMQKKPFLNRAWQVWVDACRAEPECCTEEVTPAMAKGSKTLAHAGQLADAIRSVHPGMTALEICAEEVVENHLVDLVAAGELPPETCRPQHCPAWDSHQKVLRIIIYNITILASLGK